MSTFRAKVSDIKKALNIVSLATGDAVEAPIGQAFFKITGSIATLKSSDNDRIAFTSMPITGSSGDTEFGANPKSIIALVGASDVDDVEFTHDESKSTLFLQVSDDSDAKIALPTVKYDPTIFSRSFKDVADMTLVSSVYAESIVFGMKFQQGFTSQDDKNTRFSMMYIKDGLVYGSNGSTRIGLYKNEDIKGVYNLSIRRPNIQCVLNFIGTTASENVKIKETAKEVMFTTEDETSGFGFIKTVIEMPNFPASVDRPNMDVLKINRAQLIKKLSRLLIAAKDDPSIKIEVQGGVATITTYTERPSTERIAIAEGKDGFKLSISCQELKSLLSSYMGTLAELYVDEKRCIIYESGEMIIDDDKDETKTAIKKPFTMVAVVGLSKEV